MNVYSVSVYFEDPKGPQGTSCMLFERMDRAIHAKRGESYHKRAGAACKQHTKNGGGHSKVMRVYRVSQQDFAR
jgi:hypothetical protein